jgi:hypothetical protein
MGDALPPIVFGTFGVNPPTDRYISQGDKLIVRAQLNFFQLTTELFVSARILLTDGTVSWHQWPITVVQNAGPQTFVIGLTEGFLLGVSVTVSPRLAIVFQRGQCYASLWLGLGSAAAPIFLHPLCAGYVTSNHALGWPGGPMEAPESGRGSLELYTPAGGGIPHTFGVALFNRMRPCAIGFTFTTSAVAGNRFVFVRYELAGLGRVIWDRISPSAQATGLTWDYRWGPQDVDDVVQTQRVNIGGLGELWLPSSCELLIGALNNGAGDAQSNLAILFEVLCSSF